MGWGEKVEILLTTVTQNTTALLEASKIYCYENADSVGNALYNKNPFRTLALMYSLSIHSEQKGTEM